MNEKHPYFHAYLLGTAAHERGWERASCQYRGGVREAYWLAGFDGYSFEEAKAAHEEAKRMKRELVPTMGFSRIGLRNV
jgi:hypothetical protein